MGKVFFSSGEIVVNGSRDAGVSNDNHDNLEVIFEKRHAFKAFFRRLVKEIFSRNSCRSFQKAPCNPSASFSAAAAESRND